MKRRPWTPLKSFLRASSRRSRKNGRTEVPVDARFFCPAGFIVLLLILTPVFSPCQSVDITAERDVKRVKASVTLNWNGQPELLALLKDGLESRITFTVRLWEERPMIFQLLGERLVAEMSRSQSVFFDFLDDKFVVEAENGKRALHAKADDCLRDFFSWSDIILAEGKLGRIYVTARVQFDPVRLMPPLTIVTLVGGTETYMSPWVRAEVVQR
jgi:hypothetical protein